jgi:hypothetical protein
MWTESRYRQTYSRQRSGYFFYGKHPLTIVMKGFLYVQRIDIGLQSRC